MYCRCRESLLNLFFILGILLISPVLVTAQINPANLLPASTIFYAEVSNPPAVLDRLLRHPVVKRLQNEEVYQEILNDSEVSEFLMVLDYIESELEMEWDDALKTLTSGGITLAFDAESEGVALFLEAKDEQSLKKIVETMMKLARQDAADNNRDDPYEVDEYRGITTYGVKNGGFALYEQWFLFASNEKIGMTLLDGILDGNKSDCLADNEQFREARGRKKESDAAWLYIDLKTIRQAGVAKKLFSGKADDPFAEILLGGIFDVLQETPYATASLSGAGRTAQLSLSVPYEQSWVSETREHYFGPRGAGEANAIPEVPNLLFAASAYRNFSEMWLRAGDLFNERINDKFAEADSTLTTLFSGKDFGEDILGALSPEILFVATRQEFPQDRPAPALKLPAFALVAEMKEPKTTSKEFRRIFQSLIGFFNVVGSMNGQPQLELDMDKFDGGELISATFVPLAGEEDKDPARINFNFSPTIAFSGERVIVSSTTGLARDLITSTSPAKRDSGKRINTNSVLSAPVLKATLEDNLSQLISNNMLEEGHTREEAETEIGILLNLLGYFQAASLSLETTDQTLNLNFALELSEE